MATQWTNPVTSGSPIRAFDIQEVVNAINANRQSAGLYPFPWTDPTVSSGIPVKAVHFKEMRDAIQGLWSSKSMGTIPNWSSGTAPGGPSVGTTATPVRASHLTDLRSWVNQYENAARTINYKRGIHLRDENHRDQDYYLLNEYNPGAVVVLNPQLVNPDGSMSNEQKRLVDWMKPRVQTLGMEVFVRIIPSGQDRAVSDVGNDIFRVYDAVSAYNGLILTRYQPGNEPNTEWGLTPYLGATWDTIASYYSDVYDWVRDNKGARTIELYTPPMAQQVFAEEYNVADGSPMGLDTGELGGYNRASVKAMIQKYNSFAWHNCFYRNNAWQHRVEQYFPPWLQDHLWVNLAPARITEAGWMPADTSNRDYDFSGAGSVSYWDDMNYFMRTATRAGGVDVWLISKQYEIQGENVWKHAAVANGSNPNDPNYSPTGDGTTMRPWIQKLAMIAP